MPQRVAKAGGGLHLSYLLAKLSCVTKSFGFTRILALFLVSCGAPQNIIYQSIYHISAYSANSGRQPACPSGNRRKLEAIVCVCVCAFAVPRAELSDHLNHHKNGHSN